MEQYIKELLQPGKRVNVAGFGAFIAPNDGGNILFNQFLNFDDGILSTYISEREGITKDQAIEKIKNFVDDLNSRLNNGETVTLSGLGTITKNDGKITFVAEANTGDGSQPAAPADSTDDGDDLVLPSEDNGGQNEQQPETEMPEPAKEEPQPAAWQPEPPAQEPEKEQKSEDNPTSSETTNTVIINNFDDEEKKPKTWLWILLIILFLFLVAFVCLFIINKDNCVYKFFFGEKVEVVEPIPIKDPEPAPKDTIVVPPPAPVTNALEKRYNIVVGCYKTMDLAEARVSTLKSKGFTEAFATQLNDGWFAAVIESHSSLVEAEARQELIVDTYRIESWITNAGE